YAARDGRNLWPGSQADPSMVNALLLAGADPTIKDQAGKTALDYAVAEGYVPIADAIREFMGDTTRRPFHNEPITVGDGDQWFEAEDFDHGGEGFTWHDTETANTNGYYRPGGVDMDYAVTNGNPSFAISNAKPGEWVEYTAKFI